MGYHFMSPAGGSLAQRSDRFYLTVSLPDAKDVSVKCEKEGLFAFSAIGAQGEPFTFSLELYAAIAPQGCKTKTGLRNIICSTQKEEKGWWRRLLKLEEKPAPYLKVDWNKWCDEDEEPTTAPGSDDDAAMVRQMTFPSSNLRFGDGDNESSDDGMLYLPDLEKARGN